MRGFASTAAHRLSVVRETDGKMFFVEHQPGSNERLWVTDGTQKGTRPLKFGGSHVSFGAAEIFDGALYLPRTSKRGIHQLWRIDDTGKGVQRVIKFGRTQGGNPALSR